MRIWKRIGASLALVFGVVGVLACVGLIVGALIVHARLSAATASAYSDVDEAFSKSRVRLQEFHAVLDDAKLTTSDVKDSLAGWANRAAEERFAEAVEERLQLEAKTGAISVAFAKAGSVAEVSAESISMLAKIAEIANQAGANFDSNGLVALQQDLVRLQTKLGEVGDEVGHLSSRLRDEEETVTRRDRLASAAELAVRVLATLELIQSGLEELDQQLVASQQQVAESEPRVAGWLLLATAIAILLLLWSLCGQSALGVIGWRTIRG